MNTATLSSWVWDTTTTEKLAKALNGLNIAASASCRHQSASFLYIMVTRAHFMTVFEEWRVAGLALDESA